MQNSRTAGQVATQCRYWYFCFQAECAEPEKVSVREPRTGLSAYTTLACAKVYEHASRSYLHSRIYVVPFAVSESGCTCVTRSCRNPQLLTCELRGAALSTWKAPIHEGTYTFSLYDDNSPLYLEIVATAGQECVCDGHSSFPTGTSSSTGACNAKWSISAR